MMKRIIRAAQFYEYKVESEGLKRFYNTCVEATKSWDYPVWSLEDVVEFLSDTDDLYDRISEGIEFFDLDCNVEEFIRENPFADDDWVDFETGEFVSKSFPIKAPKFSSNPTFRPSNVVMRRDGKIFEFSFFHDGGMYGAKYDWA